VREGIPPLIFFFHICHPGLFLLPHIISLLSVIHTIYSIMQTKIQGHFTCFDRLWSSSGPIFELVQVLFKIYIVRSGIPCILVCIIVYMVCMTDNKLIIYLHSLVILILDDECSDAHPDSFIHGGSTFGTHRV